MKSDLTQIPGIGVNLAEHLTKVGYPTIASLIGSNPEDIYATDCAVHGCAVDRCVLYCYRLAVYYAEHGGELPPDKKHWWNWKD